MSWPTSAPHSTYDLTGPEALNHTQACEKLAHPLDRTIRHVPVDDETARTAMLNADLDH